MVNLEQKKKKNDLRSLFIISNVYIVIKRSLN